MHNGKTVMIGLPCLKSGGTEMQTLRLVEALVGYGYRCVTVCYFEYDYQIVQQYELSGSEVVCLSAYGTRPSGKRAVYQYLREGLRRVVERYRPEIAHIQYVAPGGMPIVILHRLGIKKIIATLHTDADIYRDLRLIHYLQRRVASVFTCVTEEAERNFFGSSSLIDSQTQYKPHSHYTIPNCLSPKVKRIGHREKDSEEEPLIIGVVARLERIKGVELIMPAFKEVVEQSGVECRLRIVGEGSQRVKMEEEMRRLGIEEWRVEWKGQIEPRVPEEQYAEMDVLWMPSRSEGFGLTAIEAMAQGCVVVASPVGGLKELVKEGENGVFFEQNDSRSLAQKTLQLLTDREELRKMRKKAEQSIEAYRYEAYRERIGILYSKIEG